MLRRREELVRLLDRRRRRTRLLLVCLATALACGVVAGVAAPQVLIGGVSSMMAADDGAAKKGRRPARPAKVAPAPLALSERLEIDPRESQANALRWATLAQPERRKLLDRYWRLAEKDPAVQERIFQRYDAFRDLSEKRQEFLRARALKLKEFMKTLGPQDQAVLLSLAEPERAQRLLDLWQARYGTW